MKLYPVNKNTKIPEFGIIPDHWNLQRMKWYFESIVNGSWGEDPHGDNKDTIVLRVADFDDLGISDKNLTKRYIDEKAFSSRCLRNGDLIIEKSGGGEKTPVGRVVLFNKKYLAITSNFLARLRIKNNFEPKFVLYSLTDLYQKKIVLKSIKQTTGIQNLDFGSYSNEYTAIPTIEEQEQIAKFLDYKIGLIKSLIAKNLKLIDLLEDKKQSMVYQAITKGLNHKAKMRETGIEWIGKIPEHWNLMKLQHLFEVKKNIARSLGYQILSITQKGIKVKDIQDNEGQISSDYSKYQIVEEGDFAMNHMDLLTGYVDVSPYKGVTSPDYRVFQLKNKENNSQFLLHLLQICYKKRLFYAHGRGAAHFGRWRLGINEFNAFVFPVPPAPEQQDIVTNLDALRIQTDEMIEKLKRQNNLLAEYRQALISNVVTGKIDLRDEKIPEKLLAN